MAKTIVDLIGSMLWDLIWLLLSLIWGTLRLYNNRWLVSRFLAEDQHYNDLEENSWEFGQLVPVLLLLMPLLNIVETVINGTENTVLREQSATTNLPQSDLLNHNSQEQHLRGRTSPDRPRSCQLALTHDNILNCPGLNEVTTLHNDGIYHEPWFQDNIFITVILFLLYAALILSLGNGQGAVRFFIDCAQSPLYWLQIPSLVVLPLFYTLRRFSPMSLASGPVFVLVNFVLGESVKHRLCRLVYFSSVILPIWYFFFWKIQNQPFQNPSYHALSCYIILLALLYLPMIFLCIWVVFSSSALLHH
ncbi:hypothetical protein BDV59DRAFT_189900 [Aspergillus ambiguus]|uniref:uncharacterized protein n=1 Tax=Aspergillus ambiguus TaxID=176160 RepID=UPI003CCD1667